MDYSISEGRTVYVPLGDLRGTLPQFVVRSVSRSFVCPADSVAARVGLNGDTSPISNPKRVKGKKPGQAPYSGKLRDIPQALQIEARERAISKSEARMTIEARMTSMTEGQTAYGFRPLDHWTTGPLYPPPRPFDTPARDGSPKPRSMAQRHRRTSRVPPLCEKQGTVPRSACVEHGAVQPPSSARAPVPP